MWAWRQSLGNVSPSEFLEHLEDLLPQDWCYQMKKKEASPCIDKVVTSFQKNMNIIVSLRRKRRFANFPMEFSHGMCIHLRLEKSPSKRIENQCWWYSILILSHGRLCAGFPVVNYTATECFWFWSQLRWFWPFRLWDQLRSIICWFCSCAGQWDFLPFGPRCYRGVALRIPTWYHILQKVLGGVMAQVNWQDRFGRARVLTWTLVPYTLATACTAVSTGICSFAIFQFLAAAFITAAPCLGIWVALVIPFSCLAHGDSLQEVDEVVASGSTTTAVPRTEAT